MEKDNMIMGYAIERTNNPKLPYYLIGKRGATYGLFRYDEKPSTMYVMNGNGNICAIKGNYTFNDESGSLVAIS